MIVAIDFEYCRTNEPFVKPVCCSMRYEGGVTESWWLHDFSERDLLLARLCEMKERKDILLSYQAGAEARALAAVGVDMAEYPVIDLYAEWRMMTNNNNRCAYGRYFIGELERKSVPPSLNPMRNIGKDNTPIGFGLAAAVGRMLGIAIDTNNKKEMRELIISDPEEYTEEQKRRVMEYCESDVVHLHPLLRSLTDEFRRLVRVSDYSDERLLADRLSRGRYSVRCAQMEMHGMPLDLSAVENIGRNHDAAKDELITALLAKGYPFYERAEAKANAYGQGEWVMRYDAFAEYLKKRRLTEGWPKTDTGKFKCDNDTLKEFEDDEGIGELRETSKAVRQIGWFRPEGSQRVGESIGSDGRLRVFLAPFGTQTARNAPKPSKGYIPAMSSWLRALVSPPEGYGILGIDYASQEFALAAVISGDKNMKAAYASGDPYLAFAKIVGSVPQDATKKSHEKQRDLSKGTCLGLQYGLGVKKLARKLTMETGTRVTYEVAELLIGQHKKAFPDLWEWRKDIVGFYRRKKWLMLPDGWFLFGDNPNDLSIANTPIQGTGTTILRRAVENSHREGIGKRLMSPLHDAIYGVCRIEDEVSFGDALSKAMDDAVSETIGTELVVRQDREFYPHGKPWVPKKGLRWYRDFSKWFQPHENPQDAERKISDWLA